jgi:hypothetical protein
VGALRRLGGCSTRCHLKMWSLGMPGIGTCEMRARAEGTGTILTNATGGCVTRLCYFCGGVDCTCQHGCT